MILISISSQATINVHETPLAAVRLHRPSYPSDCVKGYNIFI